MPIMDEYVDVKINSRNVKYYCELGYVCKIGDIIKVLYYHAKASKEIFIHVRCDYCNKEFYITTDAYMSYKKKNNINKICCNNSACQKQKREESMMEKYGVKDNGKLESTKEKRKKTMLKKYGVDNPMKNKQIQEKAKKTILEKYGVENVMQNDDIKKRYNDSMVEKYGVKWAMQNEEIFDKSNKTLFDKYGATLKKYNGIPLLIEHEDIKEKIKNTLKEKYNVDNPLALAKHYATSNAENYIASLLDVQQSFCIDSYIVDMKINNTNILIEYDGSGHELKRKFYSDKYYESYESTRESRILSYGFKIIRLVSHTDKLPSDKDIINIINDGIEYLKTNTIYKFDLDKMKRIQ